MMFLSKLFVVSFLLASVSSVVGFTTTPTTTSNASSFSSLSMADTMAQSPNNDDAATVSNSDNKKIAKYLVNLHDNQETFDFCGGMMFQLVLTDALRDHLLKTADSNTDDVKVYENTPRMFNTPNYQQTSDADNIEYFHGREIRNVPNAKGGMGMVLQLSLANGNDKEGWTSAEISRYDGWGHDSGREWRKGTQLVEEGYTNFKNQFGNQAFSLHHRFYFHRDIFGSLWLAAEDGCQGTPKPTKNLSNLFGLLS